MTLQYKTWVFMQVSGLAGGKSCLPWCNKFCVLCVVLCCVVFVESSHLVGSSIQRTGPANCQANSLSVVVSLAACFSLS